MKRLFDKDVQWSVPDCNSAGTFGAVRKYDIHQGVDLYVPSGTIVYSLEQCIVIDVYWFTGVLANPSMPWWNNTKAVLVYNRFLHNYSIYGEIYTDVKIGDILFPGNKIGHVIPVLKKDKGLPMSMLHFEMWSNKPINYNPWIPWTIKEEMPKYLIDPTWYLNKVKEYSYV